MPHRKSFLNFFNSFFNVKFRIQIALFSCECYELLIKSKLLSDGMNKKCHQSRGHSSNGHSSSGHQMLCSGPWLLMLMWHCWHSDIKWHKVT